MVKIREYNPGDKMISLISENYRLLHVLSRFGIQLGFNDKTIKEVCCDENVDCKTFLTVVNFLLQTPQSTTTLEDISLVALLQYLKQSHVYFLDFYLPSIRRKLLDGITLKDSDVSFLIIKLFDEYVEGIKRHMEDEEKHLFSFVEQIIEGEETEEKDLKKYSQPHEEVGKKLRELKNIILKYSPADTKANLLNAALYDIYRCEEELEDHCRVEDMLLLPSLRLKRK